MITYFHPRKKLLILISVTMVFTRGVVEDTSLEAKAKDTKKFRGQGQSLSRPRTKNTDASVLQKKRRFSKQFFKQSQKKVFKNFFQAKKVFKNFFSGNLYLRKPKKRSLQIFLKVSGVFQRNFNGSKIVLSSNRGQGNFRGLESSRPRTSKCVLEDVLEAKDVLEDSTSGTVFTILIKIDRVEAFFILVFYFYYCGIRTHDVA